VYRGRFVLRASNISEYTLQLNQLPNRISLLQGLPPDEQAARKPLWCIGRQESFQLEWTCTHRDASVALFRITENHKTTPNAHQAAAVTLVEADGRIHLGGSTKSLWPGSTPVDLFIDLLEEMEELLAVSVLQADLTRDECRHTTRSTNEQTTTTPHANVCETQFNLVKLEEAEEEEEDHFHPHAPALRRKLSCMSDASTDSHISNSSSSSSSIASSISAASEASLSLANDVRCQHHRKRLKSRCSMSIVMNNSWIDPIRPGGETFAPSTHVSTTTTLAVDTSKAASSVPHSPVHDAIDPAQRVVGAGGVIGLKRKRGTVSPIPLPPPSWTEVVVV